MSNDPTVLLLPHENASKVPPHLKYRSNFLLGKTICLEAECALLHFPELEGPADLFLHLEKAHKWSELAIKAIHAYHGSLRQHPHHIGFFCVHPDCHEKLNEHTRDMTNQEMIEHYQKHHKNFKLRSWHFVALARSNDGHTFSHKLSQYSTEDLEEAFDGLLVELSVHTSGKRHLLSRLSSLPAHTEHVAHSHLYSRSQEEPGSRDVLLTQYLQTFAAMVRADVEVSMQINDPEAPCIYTDDSEWLNQHPRIKDIRSAAHVPSGDYSFGTAISRRIDTQDTLAMTLNEAIKSHISSINQASLYILRENGIDKEIKDFIAGSQERNQTLCNYSAGLNRITRQKVHDLSQCLNDMGKLLSQFLTISQDICSRSGASNHTDHGRRPHERFQYSEYPLFYKHMRQLTQISSFECPICPSSQRPPGGFVREHFLKAHAHRLWSDVLGDDIEAVFEPTAHQTRPERLGQLQDMLKISLESKCTPDTQNVQKTFWEKSVKEIIVDPFALSGLLSGNAKREENLLIAIRTANILLRFYSARAEYMKLTDVLNRHKLQSTVKPDVVKHHIKPLSKIFRRLDSYEIPVRDAIEDFANASHKMVALNMIYFQILYDLAHLQLNRPETGSLGSVRSGVKSRVYELLAWIALQSQNRLSQNARSTDHYLYYHHTDYHVQFKRQIDAISVILGELLPPISSHHRGHHHTQAGPSSAQ